MTTAQTTDIAYDGTLAGLVSTADGWVFEGVEYDTPATESDVIECAHTALEEPDAPTVKAAHALVFDRGCTYTSQALLAIAAAYDAEVGPDGTGSEQILAILRETARRIACIEALTI